LLIGVRVPVSRSRPAWHRGNLLHIRRLIIRAQEQRAAVIRRDPKSIIPGDRRHDVPVHPRPVIVVNVRRRFKKVSDLIHRRRAIRIRRAVRQVGDGVPTDACEVFARDRTGARRRRKKLQADANDYCPGENRKAKLDLAA